MLSDPWTWISSLISMFKSDKEAKEVIAYLNITIFLVIKAYECIDHLLLKSQRKNERSRLWKAEFFFIISFFFKHSCRYIVFCLIWLTTEDEEEGKMTCLSTAYLIFKIIQRTLIINTNVRQNIIPLTSISFSDLKTQLWILVLMHVWI